MIEFENRGKELRNITKSLIIDYMNATPSCQSGSEGMRLAEIFRNCGFDLVIIQKRPHLINNIGLLL